MPTLSSQSWHFNWFLMRHGHWLVAGSISIILLESIGFVISVSVWTPIHLLVWDREVLNRCCPLYSSNMLHPKGCFRLGGSVLEWLLLGHWLSQCRPSVNGFSYVFIFLFVKTPPMLIFFLLLFLSEFPLVHEQY